MALLCGGGRRTHGGAGVGGGRSRWRLGRADTGGAARRRAYNWWFPPPPFLGPGARARGSVPRKKKEKNGSMGSRYSATLY